MPMIDTAASLSPLLRMALLGMLLASGPLLWLHLRQRGAAPTTRLRALTVLTLFLSFDLVMFGAFTRLTDSGLGCPDWPGCYGSASPVGASQHIAAAQSAMPTGPVTHGKAWVEMIHRYVASAVGVLILALCVMTWRLSAVARRGGQVLLISPWWASATLVWVCVQGAFGALTVTMKLFPAIVSLHLMGGVLLLMLLTVQAHAYEPKRLGLSPALHRATWLMLGLVLAQIALGAWVSTNYAVLACDDFPTCQGQWWPAMDFEQGFTLWRELGVGSDGTWLSFAALTAIHLTHRLGAVVVLIGLVWLAYGLLASRAADQRSWALRLLALAALQLLSGLSNAVLGWPLPAAIAHTGGAAALAVVLTLMLTRAGESRKLFS